MHWIAWPCLPAPEGGVVASASVGAGAVTGASGAKGAAAAACLPGTEAWWALRFTPRVARVDEALLLEVSTTERLWGGRAALLAQLRASAPAWGEAPGGGAPCVATLLAEGPTAFQALALLRLEMLAGPDAADVRGAPGVLGAPGVRRVTPLRIPQDLPLHTLTALRPHVASLARMGCNTWGQLRALPRDGVARRLGAAALRALDCAYGDAPHQHTWLELPEVFALTAELPALATSADALLWSAHALLQALQAWLQARQQGVLALELSWHHDLRKVDGKPVPAWQALPVRTAQPTQALAHLRRLLAEHLARTPLAAPVDQIALRALQTVPMPHASASLLPPTGREGREGRHAQDDARSESWHQWVERLSARLGPEQVQCVALQADHRPERMQRWQPASQTLGAGDGPKGAMGMRGSRRDKAGNGAVGAASSPESCTSGSTFPSGGSEGQAPDASLWPTWLLRPPQRLSVQGSRPSYQGPLRLLAGPHRLEAAWWEAAVSDALDMGAGVESDADARPGAPHGAEGNATGAPAPAPGLVVRDYFVAYNDRAGHVWVYRERWAAPAAPPDGAVPQAPAHADGRALQRQDRWFLHGIYG